jgi:hypothetical protein
MKSGKKLAKEKSSLGSPLRPVKGFFWKYRKYIQPTYVPANRVGKKLIDSTTINAMTVENTITNSGIHCKFQEYSIITKQNS